MDDSKKNTPLISVVVCTYNRAELLNICLQSLEKQNISLSKYEIIVINNNSSDNTQEVTDKFIKKYPNVRCVIEKKQGLSHSRNRGYKEANGEYIAYIDDDAKAPGNWLSVAEKIITEKSPDIFGGPIFPFYLSPKPEWFKDEYEIRIHHPVTGWVSSDRKRLLSGSNIFFQKNILYEYDGFNINLGMSGDNIAYGEESELVIKALRNNKKVYYSHDLTVEHLVPEYKMNLWFFIYSNYKWGKDNIVVWQKEYDTENLIELVGLLDAIMENFNKEIKIDNNIENTIIDNYSKMVREIGKRAGYILRSEENIKMQLNKDFYAKNGIISTKDYLQYNLKMFKKTRLGKFISRFL